MTTDVLVRDQDIEALRSMETCVVSNAIETFDVRLRNTGFARSTIRCFFEDLPPMVGYAATARLRSSEPPMAGRAFHDRSDWWNSILAIPYPRIVVLEDIDESPGIGAFLGDMHAAMLRALGCVGFVTNGAVRELPRVRRVGLQVFAGNVAVSHAYAHIFDLGAEVNVGGLGIKPNDLLHGDRHGVLTVPKQIAGQIPSVAARLQQMEQRVIDYCQSKDFSLAELQRITRDLS
ncbi:MAG TPA: RraA family protein [Terriglobales bacterium]|nr:RraA family protein [Terriglobales bacterium]